MRKEASMNKRNNVPDRVLFKERSRWLLAAGWGVVILIFGVLQATPYVVKWVNTFLNGLTDYRVPDCTVWCGEHMWLWWLPALMLGVYTVWRVCSAWWVPSSVEFKNRIADWLRQCGLDEYQIGRLKIRVRRNLSDREVEVTITNIDGGLDPKYLASQAVGSCSIVSRYVVIQAKPGGDQLTIYFFRRTENAR